MEVSVDVVRVRKRMVMIIFAKKGRLLEYIHVLLIHLILFIEMFVYILYRYVCGGWVVRR